MGETVKVRGCLLIGEGGEWVLGGESGWTDEKARLEMEGCLLSRMVHCYFVTAEAEVVEPPSVVGEVSDG